VRSAGRLSFSEGSFDLKEKGRETATGSYGSWPFRYAMREGGRCALYLKHGDHGGNRGERLANPSHLILREGSPPSRTKGNKKKGKDLAV